MTLRCLARLLKPKLWTVIKGNLDPGNAEWMGVGASVVIAPVGLELD
ncbi:MAG: hypothetical protein NT140_03855 [Deltaproteobacteria bacterium]|nr:hypothetical protein [Deltaproteobacteria bacterium]